MTDTVETSKIPRVLLYGALVILVIAIGVGATRNFDNPGDEDTGSASVVGSGGASGPEAVIASLEERTRKQPDDVEGWQLLGWSYFEIGRYRDAADAYAKATQLEPGRAIYWSSLGESLVMADEADPMPVAARSAFDKAIAIDPKDPRARYFRAVSKDLSGDHDGAITDWLALLGDTPKGAPWEADLVRTIEQVGQINKTDVTQKIATARSSQPAESSVAATSVAAAPIPGPTRADMAQAAKLPPGQQQQMVETMVEGLEAKLQKDPANVDGWIMLMRSRMTLGETAKAAAALKKSVAANPGAKNKLTSEARILGVPGA